MVKKDIKFEHENCLARYLENCKKMSMGSQALRTRKSAITKFLKFLLKKEISLKDTRHTHIEWFLAEEKEALTSASTLNNYMAYLKAFFEFLRFTGDNDQLNFSKVRFKCEIDKNLETFTEAEIKEMFRIIDEIDNDLIQKRCRVLFLLVLITGCTKSEALSLNVYDSINDVIDDDNFIVLDEQTVYFRGNSLRKLALPESFISEVNSYHRLFEEKKCPGFANNRRRFLFPSTRGEKAGFFHRMSDFHEDITRVKKKSDFGDKQLSLKNLRHTIISLLVETEKLDIVSEIVGLDVSSLKSYIKSKEEFDKEINDIMTSRHPLKNLF